MGVSELQPKEHNSQSQGTTGGSLVTQIYIMDYMETFFAKVFLIPYTLFFHWLLIKVGLSSSFISPIHFFIKMSISGCSWSIDELDLGVFLVIMTKKK